MSKFLDNEQLLHIEVEKKQVVYNQLLEQLLLQYGTAISTRLTECEVTESREPVSGAVHNQNKDLMQQDELKMQQKIQSRIAFFLKQLQTCTCRS